MISNSRIKISSFFWRHCDFLPLFSFQTPCWSWRGWDYSDQPVAVWVAVTGVVLRASIQGDPHLLTVSQSSPLCSLSIWPCHRGTEWQIGTGRKQRRGIVGGISFRKQALLKPLQNKIKDSCQMLYWAHCWRARKWHYQWWSQRFIATGELKLSFISISSPHRLYLFYCQSSVLSITTWNTSGRQLGGNIRTNELCLLIVFHMLSFALNSCHWKTRAMCLSYPQMAVSGLVWVTTEHLCLSVLTSASVCLCFGC